MPSRRRNRSPRQVSDLPVQDGFEDIGRPLSGAGMDDARVLLRPLVKAYGFTLTQPFLTIISAEQQREWSRSGGRFSDSRVALKELWESDGFDANRAAKDLTCAVEDYTITLDNTLILGVSSSGIQNERRAVAHFFAGGQEDNQATSGHLQIEVGTFEVEHIGAGVLDEIFRASRFGLGPLALRGGAVELPPKLLTTTLV